MRHLLIALSMLLCPVAFAQTQISIGFNMSVYPDLILVPGMPVYYDPRVEANYFFYDGLYWVYQDDDWYASNWYDGPWDFVGPEAVPLFLLRVPVRFYRRPPMYFRGWRDDAPPRWGEHWGRSWEQRRGGWDRWDRNDVPHAAPLPSYQRTYSGGRYPREAEQQRTIQSRNYHYRSREAVEMRATRPPPQQPDRQQQADRQQRQQRSDPQPQRAENKRPEQHQRPNQPSGEQDRKPRPRDRETQGKSDGKNDGRGNRDDRSDGRDH